MRTKALICAAALIAATSASQAQVFSVNVVGYITLTLTNGLNLIANPLDVDGTGVNNTLPTVFGNTIPNLSVATAFNPATGSYSNCTYNTALAKWGGPTNAVNAALAPGKGIFFKVPSGVLTTNITIVGNVLQGTLSNNVIVANQILSSQVPQAGTLVTNLSYTPANLDRVSQWNAPGQKFFSANTYNLALTKWGGGDPNLKIAESFFIVTHTGSKWNRNFTVQ